MEDNKNMNQFFSTSNLLDNASGIYVGMPIVDELIGKDDWIKFGRNNDFPQELNQLYEYSSPLHKNLIDKQIELSVGNGWNPTEELKPFLQNPYGKEDLNELALETCKDLVIHGYYYLKIYWAKDGKQISALQSIPAEKVRIQKPDNEGNVNHLYISRDWTKVRKTENKPELVPAFNPELAKEQPCQILMVKNLLSKKEFYGMPRYSAVLNFLRINYKIGEYHLNGLNNNLMLGSIVYVPDNNSLNEQQKQRVADGIDAKYSNAKNAQKTMVIFYKDEASKPTVQPLTLPNTDSRFLQMMDMIIGEIMRAHGATPLVAANQISGKLGGQTDIETEYKLFQSTVIQFYQRNIERTFNKLKNVNGYTDELKLNQFMLFDSPAPSGTTSTFILKPNE